MIYFPVLRSKRNELVAIKESKLLFDQENVLPIIEPFHETDMNSFIQFVAKHKLPCIVVINPIVGEFVLDNRKLISMLNSIAGTNHRLNLGFNLHSGITNSQIDDFFDIYPDWGKVIIHHCEYKDQNKVMKNKTVKAHIFNKDNHLSDDYINVCPKDKCVLLADNFVKQSTNKDYLKKKKDFFSKQLVNSDNEKLLGFSDYLTIGKDLNDGFTPKCVAIHVTTFEKSTRQLFVNHYVSDVNSNTQNQREVPEKYLDAKNKFNSDFENGRSDFLDTDVLNEFYADNEFHGLGFLKKISIKHHIELVNTLLGEKTVK